LGEESWPKPFVSFPADPLHYMTPAGTFKQFASIQSARTSIGHTADGSIIILQVCPELQKLAGRS
jgi:hypothetical protein